MAEGRSRRAAVPGTSQDTGRRILQAKRKNKVYDFENKELHIPKPWDTSKLNHNGEVYNLGDIIRLTGEDEKIYYGEILRFWSDPCTEKYVTIQWLIPTENISKDGDHFDPNKYTHGPVHTEPINVRCIGFVMNAFTFGAPPNSPVFNRTGQLAVIFNSNIPATNSLCQNPYVKLK